MKQLAPRLTERISLHSPEVERNALGEQVRTGWTAGVALAAEVVTVRGAEFIAAMQAQYRVDLRVRIRWRNGVDNRQSIVWRGQRYAVREVMDAGPRRQYIEMLCSSGVEDGN